MCLLKEWDSNFTSDHAEVGGVGSLEQLVEDALLLGGKIQVRMSLGCNFHNQSRLLAFSSRCFLLVLTIFTAAGRVSERRIERGRGPEFGGSS
jgi:hypothetical protein